MAIESHCVSSSSSLASSSPVRHTTDFFTNGVNALSIQTIRFAMTGCWLAQSTSIQTEWTNLLTTISIAWANARTAGSPPSPTSFRFSNSCMSLRLDSWRTSYLEAVLEPRVEFKRNIEEQERNATSMNASLSFSAGRLSRNIACSDFENVRASLTGLLEDTVFFRPRFSRTWLFCDNTDIMYSEIGSEY